MQGSRFTAPGDVGAALSRSRTFDSGRVVLYQPATSAGARLAWNHPHMRFPLSSATAQPANFFLQRPPTLASALPR